MAKKVKKNMQGQIKITYYRKLSTIMAGWEGGWQVEMGEGEIFWKT